MLTELEEVAAEQSEEKERTSLNSSFICAEIIEQLIANKQMRALPELTLNLGKGITPEIIVYERE